jgi:hypothetical protein
MERVERKISILKKILAYTMNLLHGITLILLCTVILMDVKVPPEIKSLGKIPVTITLLFVVFYLFTQSPLLGVIGLVAAYQAMQSNQMRYIQPQLPMDGEFTPQNQFQDTLEEKVVQNMVPFVQTQSPVHLQFKYNVESTHSAAPIS